MTGHTRLLIPLAMILIMSISACSSDGQGGPMGPKDPGLVTVVGEVTRIEDLIPVDGGVTIEMRRYKGETVLLLYASWFTNPPPSQEHIALYEVILEVDVGDRVRARGRQIDRGIELKELTILEEESKRR